VCSDTSVHYGQGAIFVGFLVRFGHVIIATALLLPLISWAPASADATVRIGGSTHDTPALTKIAASYQPAHPGTTIAIKGSSSGEGIAALRGHFLDIACSDVAVDDPDLIDTKLGVVGFVFVVGGGAGVTNLTRADVQGIYSGTFTNWKQVGGNDLPIVPLSRPLGVGTRFIFETTVAKTLVDMKTLPDATAVVNTVATTPGAIGYSSTNYVGDHQNLVVNYEGVAPTDVNIVNHIYKFATDEHAYTLKDATPETRAFLAYVATQPAILKSYGILTAADASPAKALRVEGTLNQATPLQKAAAAYQLAHPGSLVEVKATNSGQGIAALRNGDTDVAASDISVDYPEFVDSTIGVLGVAVLAGPHAGVKNITRDQLVAIYSGKIKNWKEIGGEDQPIVVFGRAIGTGTRMLFETKVAKVEIPTQDPVNPLELVHDVATTPGAVGYIATSFVANQPELVLTYNGVAPTPGNIRSHAYEFSTDEHLYTRKGGPAAARAFVTFVTSQRETLASSGIY
jgi:phosphate transport system substrate-binding protein